MADAPTFEELADSRNIAAMNEEIRAIAEKTATADKTEEAGGDESQITEYKMEVEIAPGKSIFVTGKTEAEANLKAEIAQQTAAAVRAQQIPAKVEEKKGLTQDEIVALQLKLSSGEITEEDYLDQSGAFDRLLDKRGLNPEKINSLLAEEQTKTDTQRWQDATNSFKAEHPEYQPSMRNQDLLGVEILKQMQADPSLSQLDAIEKAYSAALAKGENYLDVRPAEGNEERDLKEVFKEETKEFVPPAPAKKKATSSAIFGSDGRSDVRQSTPKTDMPPLTEQQWNGMSLDQQATWYNEYVARKTGRKAPDA